MRLVRERVGSGPRGGELVSLAHYGEQHDDLMRNPKIVFEVAAGQWQPASIQQDSIGSSREAAFVGEDGKVYVRPAEMRDFPAGKDSQGSACLAAFVSKMICSNGRSGRPSTAL
jgi:hypothetical protein